MKTIYITESQKNRLNDLLFENEGTNMKRARKYLESKGYSPIDRQRILDSIRTDIPNSRLQQCKFLLGVTRLYMEGQLNDGRAIASLNKTLKYIASDAHVNEYDFNLNGENLGTLVQRFAGVAKNDLEQSRNASNARQLTINNNYTIVPIDTPEEASKYGKYTSWCVTHDENMYNSYTNNGSGRFYFCLRKGFENEPEVEGDGCPLDNYGLSMIAVSVTMEGEVNTITCRWNHDNGGNDNIMTIEQLENVIGRNFYQIFKPYTREELHAKGVILFDEVQDLLDSGKKPEEIFDYCDDFIEGFARVELNGKFNFINRERKLLSSQWFDYCDDFIEGFARVELNDKYNFINGEGKVFSNQWFDDCGDFNDGFAWIRLNSKYNFINGEGKLLSSQWFDTVMEFKNGKALVSNKIEGVHDYSINLIDEQGNFVYDWTDTDTNILHDGRIIVISKNNKQNFLDRYTNHVLSNQWFDKCWYETMFGIVKQSGKYNFFNYGGAFHQLLSDEWFDNVYPFNDYLGVVCLNNKYNFLKTNGELLTKWWFDDVGKTDYEKITSGNRCRYFYGIRDNRVNIIDTHYPNIMPKSFDKMEIDNGRIIFIDNFEDAVYFVKNDNWYKIKDDRCSNYYFFNTYESKNTPKTVIITEEQKRLLKENILLDELPEDITNAILQGKTSLKNNPAIPNVFENSYLETVMKKRFKETIDELKKIGEINDVPETDIPTVLNKLILKCQELEKPYRSELEKLCYNYVIGLFDVPDDTVTVDFRLVDEVDLNKSSIKLDPIHDDSDDIEYEDIKQFSTISDEVYKRRMLNVLAMGAGLQVSSNIKSYLSDIYDINPKLPDLYRKIIALNNYLLLTKETLGMNEENKMQIGTVEITLGNEDDKVKIEAQGEIFPVLLSECVRGFMELFASHGLPKDKEILDIVLAKSDYLKAEPWDMRIGPSLWTILSENFEGIDFKTVPYLFKKISSLSCKNFNKFMQEVLAKTKTGKRLMGKLIEKSKTEKEYNKFSDKMSKLQTDKNIITDEYIHPEEL